MGTVEGSRGVVQPETSQRPRFTDYLREVWVIRHKDCSADGSADGSADDSAAGSSAGKLTASQQNQRGVWHSECALCGQTKLYERQAQGTHKGSSKQSARSGVVRSVCRDEGMCTERRTDECFVAVSGGTVIVSLSRPA